MNRQQSHNTPKPSRKGPMEHGKANRSSTERKDTRSEHEQKDYGEVDETDEADDADFRRRNRA